MRRNSYFLCSWWVLAERWESEPGWRCSTDDIRYKTASETTLLWCHRAGLRPCRGRKHLSTSWKKRWSELLWSALLRLFLFMTLDGAKRLLMENSVFTIHLNYALWGCVSKFKRAAEILACHKQSKSDVFALDRPLHTYKILHRSELMQHLFCCPLFMSAIVSYSHPASSLPES